jgi:hypothetical protein
MQFLVSLFSELDSSNLRADTLHVGSLIAFQGLLIIFTLVEHVPSLFPTALVDLQLLYLLQVLHPSPFKSRFIIILDNLLFFQKVCKLFWDVRLYQN